MTRIALFLVWLLQFFPLQMIAAVGSAVGSVMFWLISERRHVTRVNLAKCFPQMPPDERERLARAHFRAFCRAMVEHGILWWSPRARIERLVRLEGLEHLRAFDGKPVILFAPHFVGLDATLQRLSLEFPVAMMYARQKNPLFERVLYEGRSRFGGRMFQRQAGIKEGLRVIAEGVRFYYLPDLDYGMNRAVFVPFFGVSAATVTGLSYIARESGAAVVPCVTRMLPGGGYVARFWPAWKDFPGASPEADTRRMMAFIEERVLEMPEQYHWLHKRFKTRPAGEAGFY
jgi:Kdo2-lipid IVA lauroyltransferase/acyltransferase